MKNIIGIIDYGVAGNIYSIQKAIQKAGGTPKIINKKEDFTDVCKIVIPGVGSFKDAIDELKNDNLLDTLKEEIKSKPTLGICLGMQILCSFGSEYGESKGLGMFNAKVKPLNVQGKIPHVGFKKIEVANKSNLLEGIEDEQFYFMHSYEIVNCENTTSFGNYCNHKFTSSIQKDNIYGVQFHPEKSREAGITLFKNFINL